MEQHVLDRCADFALQLIKHSHVKHKTIVIPWNFWNSIARGTHFAYKLSWNVRVCCHNALQIKTCALPNRNRTPIGMTRTKSNLIVSELRETFVCYQTLDYNQHDNEYLPVIDSIWSNDLWVSMIWPHCNCRALNYAQSICFQFLFAISHFSFAPSTRADFVLSIQRDHNDSPGINVHCGARVPPQWLRWIKEKIAYVKVKCVLRCL